MVNSCLVYEAFPSSCQHHTWVSTRRLPFLQAPTPSQAEGELGDGALGRGKGDGEPSRRLPPVASVVLKEDVGGERMVSTLEEGGQFPDTTLPLKGRTGVFSELSLLRLRQDTRIQWSCLRYAGGQVCMPSAPLRTGGAHPSMRSALSPFQEPA